MQVKEPFRIGEWWVEPMACRISRQGVTRKLEPKAMALLVYLAERPGEVVTRQELEANIWQGLVVGYDALSGAIIKLRKAFAEDFKNPQIIETIPKIGYRLVANVTDMRGGGVSNNQGATTGPAPTTKGRPLVILLPVIVGLLVVVALLWWYPQPVPGPSATRPGPSIAVLPFVNLSDDPAQEYFSDGITDDIITDLSLISGLVVIARQSSFYFKGRTEKPEEIGRDLNAEYLLQGSVRRIGDQVRITAQLTKAQTAEQLWAERFDRKIGDVFAVQDEITKSIVSALLVQLSAHERDRLSIRPTRNVAAYDLFLQGQRDDHEGTPESIELAQARYRQAIALDPHFGRAYGALAVTTARSIIWGIANDPGPKLDQALQLARQGVELDPGSPHVHWSLGYVHLVRREHDQSLRAVQRALELAPNYADAYALLALVNNYLGHGREAIEYIVRGMALNPHYTFEYPFNLGFAHYVLGDYEKAVGPLQEAVERNVQTTMPRIYLIATYQHLGRAEDVRWQLAQLQMMTPWATLSYVRERSVHGDKKILGTLLADLEKAGLAP